MRRAEEPGYARILRHAAFRETGDSSYWSISLLCLYRRVCEGGSLAVIGARYPQELDRLFLQVAEMELVAP
jgi:hypothetical protein